MCRYLLEAKHMNNHVHRAPLRDRIEKERQKEENSNK